MHIELLPGVANVIRFPVELRTRPTLGLMREIAPDCRERSLVTEAFGLEEPAHDLRHQVDRDTAEHILNAMAPRSRVRPGGWLWSRSTACPGQRRGWLCPTTIQPQPGQRPPEARRIHGCK